MSKISKNKRQIYCNNLFCLLKNKKENHVILKWSMLSLIHCFILVQFSQEPKKSNNPLNKYFTNKNSRVDPDNNTK